MTMYGFFHHLFKLLFAMMDKSSMRGSRKFRRCVCGGGGGGGALRTFFSVIDVFHRVLYGPPSRIIERGPIASRGGPYQNF